MSKMTMLKCAGFLLCLAALSMLANHLWNIQGGIFALVDVGLLPIFIYTGVDIESRVSGRLGVEPNGLLGAAITQLQRNHGSNQARMRAWCDPPPIQHARRFPIQAEPAGNPLENCGVKYGFATRIHQPTGGRPPASTIGTVVIRCTETG